MIQVCKSVHSSESRKPCKTWELCRYLFLSVTPSSALSFRQGLTKHALRHHPLPDPQDEGHPATPMLENYGEISRYLSHQKMDLCLETMEKKIPFVLSYIYKSNTSDTPRLYLRTVAFQNMSFPFWTSSV